MADVTSRGYPSISAKNWWDLRRRLRQSIPEKLDADFLRAALRVGERHAKNIIRQLLDVGLVDQLGAPTELTVQWRDDDGYAVACHRIMEHVYPQALLDASPPPLPNPAVVERWFATNTNAGRVAVTRMALFYGLVAAADPKGHRREIVRTPEAAPAREKTSPPDAVPAREKTSTPDAVPAREKTSTPDAVPAREKTSTPDAVPAREKTVDGERSRPSADRPGNDRQWMPPLPRARSTESDFARARNRYLVDRWRVIALSILVGGIAGFVMATLMPDVYVAETAVIATQSAVTADQIGPIAETAFATDPVLQQVIDRLGLQDTPASLISTGALEARSLSDGPALLITGRASEPGLAADLANAATESFVEVAGQKGLGTFAPFESVGPGVLQPHHMGLLMLLGILAGAGVGVLVLVILFFFRDPIVSEEDARRIFAPDAAFRLQVRRRAPEMGEDARPQEDAEFEESSSAVFSMLSETIRDHAEYDGRGAAAVIVDGGDSVWAAAAVARELEARVEGNSSRREPLDGFSISSSDPRLSEILGARDAVVAIVPSGAPRRSLQRIDEEVHTLGGKFRVLVLVDPRR